VVDEAMYAPPEVVVSPWIFVAPPPAENPAYVLKTGVPAYPVRYTYHVNKRARDVAPLLTKTSAVFERARLGMLVEFAVSR